MYDTLKTLPGSTHSLQRILLVGGRAGVDFFSIVVHSGDSYSSQPREGWQEVESKVQACTFTNPHSSNKQLLAGSKRSGCEHQHLSAVFEYIFEEWGWLSFQMYAAEATSEG